MDCHSIPTTQELQKALADIGDWEPLCLNLGAPESKVNELRFDSINSGSKKRLCLEAYFNLGNTCWEKVVLVVADYPFRNVRLAKKIADENGLDYSSIAKQEL